VSFLRADRAPTARTLVDVFVATLSAHPDAPALDNGSTILTYAEFAEAADEVAEQLAMLGIGPGDRVGIRLPSGSTDLYVAILGTLFAGAAYVPVDRDDPDERARTVFAEADVSAVIGSHLDIVPRRPRHNPRAGEDPGVGDDAWNIFTSGSTGTPKGVAVSHRSAAAFVDAEARLFLQDHPLGVGDRVMAGLSVAFDASCEEMWLAWRYGACLVPAPRSLVKSGMDLGPWLIANDITVVSTVPTLLLLWPIEALDRVRLLILGGEACPPEIATRFAHDAREVWNTYGPTEATVVACAARLTPDEEVRIGLPLDGWDLAVVDGDGNPVAEGEIGQLIIGGVGLARYLDAEKDSEMYAPAPRLGWARAYRSGDLVKNDASGLIYHGRADDQIKFGGRRLELGEVDAALLALPGVVAAAAAVRTTKAGNKLLVGYVAVDDLYDERVARERLAAALPTGLVPRLAVVDTLPTRTSGKIDRDALPWPLLSSSAGELSGSAAWIAQIWSEVLGADGLSGAADFFALGGGSLAAAQVVSRIRERFGEITVADIYERPVLQELAVFCDEMTSPAAVENRPVRPMPRKSQIAQLVAAGGLRTLGGIRWLVWSLIAARVCVALGGPDWLPSADARLLASGWVLLVSPPGRMALAALGARLILRGLTPGEYPRGGKVHLRLWLAQRYADELGATNIAGAALVPSYARALGAKVGTNVSLHSLPPITGFLDLGDECSVEPEVDLNGHWLDGDVLRLGTISIGKRSRIGTRSTLNPGSRIGNDVSLSPGSAVFGAIPDGERWSGAPAQPAGTARPETVVEPGGERWPWAFAASGIGISLLPLLSVLTGSSVVLPGALARDSLGSAVAFTLPRLLPAVVVGMATLAALTVVATRLLAIGLEAGTYPVRSRRGWQAWTTLRLLDEAHTWLFPIYSSALTPLWLRALGAKVGKDVEASTVLCIPKFVTINDGAFLADDTMIGGYELTRGAMRIGPVKIGKKAFVGNSGMTAPGRKVPGEGLVAVLSATPRKAKRGTSWLGSPPVELRRQVAPPDTSRTFDPPFRLRIARAAVEACRIVPFTLSILLGVLVVSTLLALSAAWGVLVAAVAAGPLMVLTGITAAAVTSAAKWVLVGRLSASDHPLWSAFVWRNELADTFVEVMAAPWFAHAATGTPALSAWLRSMGAKIGRGSWIETYWLPEADLISLGEGSSVNHGCVVQTHLFHERVLALDTVTLENGATLGPNSVILPAARLGRHATVGPVSLVMRGESVPAKTRWIGNPIEPWVDEQEAEGGTSGSLRP
jgi:non-ribosomal peptide synthetase-like protein